MSLILFGEDQGNPCSCDPERDGLRDPEKEASFLSTCLIRIARRNAVLRAWPSHGVLLRTAMKGNS